MHRTWAQRWLLVFLLALIPFSALRAQDEGRVLVSGQPVTGTLDGSAIVQVYTVSVLARQTVEVTAQNTLGVPLAMTLTTASGALVAQTVDADTDGQVTLAVSVLADGTYYLTVFKAAGVASISRVDFTLTATIGASGDAPAAQPTAAPTSVIELPETPVPAAANTFSVGGQVLTQSGMTIALTWSTTDDLDLEVRDPVGGSLYWQTPTTASGGTLSGNVNQQCAVTTANAPTETARWSPGGVPTGSYEILVYFQQSCNNNAPASFVITIDVNGASLPPVQGSVNPGDVFVASFEIAPDGASALTGLTGLVTDNLPDSAQNIIAAAVPIQFGVPLGGVIRNRAPYQVYAFEGRTNDLVTISMEANGGSLDTFLFLLDGAGNIVQLNDDLETGITNSLIEGALLPRDGTYYIVATRYAKRIGGTEGPYTINITSQELQLPAEFLTLPRGSLEVRLLWNTNADLQLLVRDSAGSAVFDDVPEIRSGGRLAAQGNVNCRVSTGTPFSYIYWPTQVPPRPGAYEVEVWYQNACNDTSPVSASLFVTYNGQQIITDNIRPIPNERYLTSFTINADGTVVPSDGGIIRGLSDLDYQPRVASAVTLLPGEPRSGIITQENKFDVYAFEGSAGDVITINMNATSGTLDPLLYLVDSFGNLVAENDDAVPGENINSLIANLALPASGRYIIIATHFGGRYGGTTGTYSLSLTRLN
jgi:uncharacterized protein YfaP (DUF2135 family)